MKTIYDSGLVTEFQSVYIPTPRHKTCLSLSTFTLMARSGKSTCYILLDATRYGCVHWFDPCTSCTDKCGDIMISMDLSKNVIIHQARQHLSFLLATNRFHYLSFFQILQNFIACWFGGSTIIYSFLSNYFVYWFVVSIKKSYEDIFSLHTITCFIQNSFIILASFLQLWLGSGWEKEINIVIDLDWNWFASMELDYVHVYKKPYTKNAFGL